MKTRCLLRKRNLADSHLTREQHDAIIATLEDGDDMDRSIALVLKLMSGLGLRRGEALKISLNNFSLFYGRWTLEMTSLKANQHISVETPDALVDAVEQYCREHDRRPDELVFQLNPQRMVHHFHHACDLNGISGISIHAFRHFYFTENFC